MTGKTDVILNLCRIGIERNDAEALRRISMTLHNWHEMECGDAYGRALERDETSDKPFVTYDGGNGRRRRYAIPDREKGALKRLAEIMARYPTLSSYVQGDPRGASLYILRPGDVPQGKTADAYYSCGIAVYK
jgi:hypothetical protein